MKPDAPRPEDIRFGHEDADRAVKDLLHSIEFEPVPERLLVLARTLQEALIARRNRLSTTADPDDRGKS